MVDFDFLWLVSLNKSRFKEIFRQYVDDETSDSLILVGVIALYNAAEKAMLASL